MTTYLKKIKNLIKFLVIDYVNLELRNKLPEMTAFEKELVGELRNNFMNEDKSQPGRRWRGFSSKLRFYIKWFDPRSFLRWEVIKSTMFLDNVQKECYDALRESSEWGDLWGKVIVEDEFGNPVRSVEHPATSGTLVVHAHHLFQLKRVTGVDFKDIKTVVEFGGGYGSMCRLLRRIGFDGRYYLFDLPDFLKLQKFYLDGIRMGATWNAEQSGLGSNILIDDVALLEGKVKSDAAKKLFIATWSISESPIELRDKMMKAVGDFDYFLFGFQCEFDGNDNVKYFDDLMEGNQSISWSKQYVEYWNSYYLFGKKK